MAPLTVVDEAELAAAAAEWVTSRVEAAIASSGNAILCLTGGRTPGPLYGLLADATKPWRSRIDWPRVHLCWGDERHVPPAHPDSNFGMANERLVSRVPIPMGQVHRMHGEYPDARDAAAEYETALASGFAAAHRADRTFDLILLGIGDDGHIASIFPGSPLLEPSAGTGNIRRPVETASRDRRVAAVWAAHLQTWRVTLTPAALLDARAILVLASGTAKAAAIAAALTGPDDLMRCPAQLLRRAGDRVAWMLDRAAAGLDSTTGAP